MSFRNQIYTSWQLCDILIKKYQHSPLTCLEHFTDASLLLYQVWVDYQLIFGSGAVEACLKLHSYLLTASQATF